MPPGNGQLLADSNMIMSDADKKIIPWQQFQGSCFVPRFWRARQDSNQRPSVPKTENLAINIDVQALKWFLVNGQSSPLFAQVAVSVAVKISYRQ